MPVLEPSLANLALPPWRRVRQSFPAPPAVDVAAAVAAALDSPETGGAVTPGMRVALGVGSRGIRCIQPLVRVAVAEMRRRGADVFIVPAMGSHGGATAEGQVAVLAGYGITESEVGAPVRTSMDVVQLGALPDGTPVWFDRIAFTEADAVVPVARVKPHTDFRGPVESGLLKMLAIGMGKHKGCSTLHRLGLDHFGEVIPAAGQLVLSRAPVPFGLAVVENALEEPVLVEAVPRGRMFEREQELLRLARSYMGRILAPAFDVLVIQEVGKDISGAGMDPNITGRPMFPVPTWPGRPEYQRLVVLGLTEASHGNPGAIGAADVITRAVFEQIDLEVTYTNCIASGAPQGARIPLMARDDREALVVAVRTCLRVDQTRPRIVWIRNTLELGESRLSEPLWAEVAGMPGLEAVGEPEPMRFDHRGRLVFE